MERSPPGPAIVTRAPSAHSSGGRSMCGSACASAPPTVATLRTLTLESVRSVRPITGQRRRAISDLSKARKVVMAPMRSSPLASILSSPSLRRLTRRPGRSTPAFIISISAVPPESGRASCAPRSARASFSVPGWRSSNGAIAYRDGIATCNARFFQYMPCSRRCAASSATRSVPSSSIIAAGREPSPGWRVISVILSLVYLPRNSRNSSSVVCGSRFPIQSFMRASLSESPAVAAPNSNSRAAPGRLAAFVLEHDALVEQLLADAVGRRIVLAPARALAIGNPRFDVRVAWAPIPRNRFQKDLRIPLQQTKHATEPAQLARERLLAGVDPGRQVEQRGQRFGSGEVVVHRLLEALGVGLIPIHFPAPDLLVFQCNVKPRQGRLCVLEVLVGVVDRAAVMRAQDEKAHHLGVVFLEDFAHGEEVAERLRHLLLVDLDESVVHPVLHERLVASAFGLRDLILVVRELQVHAAAVDVKRRAE